MYRTYKDARDTNASYSNLKLTYFNLKGRCEGIRYILAAGGKQYEDNRITPEEWPALKPNTPFGTLPMLEVKGVQIGDSKTIGRYVAEISGLYSGTIVEQSVIDSVVDASHDLREGIFKAFSSAKEQEEKVAAVMSYLTDSGAKIFKSLEAILQANGAEYFVGNKLSFADIWFYAALEVVMKNKNVLESFPGLDALYKRVGCTPGIVKYVEKRPQTDL